MKKLLKERFQELAGIKPLYEVKKAGEILANNQENFSQLLQIAASYYNGWVSDQTSPSQINSQHGSRIEDDPSWESVKNRLTGKELFLYFLYYSTVKHPNVTSNLSGIADGNINLFIDRIVEEISESDFDPMKLMGSGFPDFIKDLGSGDINQDRDIIMRLLTTDINEMQNVYRDLPISAEEMYDILKGGTLDSASWHASTSSSE